MRLVLTCVALLLAPAAARAQCVHDDALSRAAGSLLGSGEALSPGAIARAVREAGSDAPSVHALRDRELDDGRVARWLETLRERADSPLVCGEAQGEAGRVVLAAARAGSLTAEQTGEGGVRVRGSLSGGFGRPELVVRGADGGLLRLGVRADDLGAGVALPDVVELPALVQLVAHGPHGPRPVAERTVGGAAEENAPMTVGRADLAGRIAELRGARGASELRPNRLLAREAAEHARRVCAEGRVAHTLDPGSDPEARLALRGVRARVVGEVAARAASEAAAMDALVRSPSHQYTLVDRRFTDAGVGVAEDEAGRACVVVLLAAWPRFVGR